MDMNWVRFLQTLQAIGALLITVGLFAGIFGFLDYRQAQTVAGWPTVPGTITTSEIYTAQIRGRGVRFADAVRIEYSYFVDGALYFNDQVNVESLIVEANTELGERLLREYPEGAAVSIYHDPADPATSFLEQETPASAFSAAKRSIVLGLAALAVWWLLRKKPYQAGTASEA